MARGGGEIAPVQTAWRRRDPTEAFQSACVVFTVSVGLQLLWCVTTGASVDYEKSLFTASCFAIAYGVSGMVFKTKMVTLR